MIIAGEAPGARQYANFDALPWKCVAMPEILITERDVLLAVAIAAIVYSFLLLFAWLRQSRAAVLGGKRESSALAELADLRARVERLERRLDEAPEVVPDSGQDTLYGDASRLVEKGLSVDEVAARLGLSRAEVDLIAALRGGESANGR